jgi:hypothetical protein
MRRIAVVATLSLGLVASLPESAAAGGASWFELERPSYMPGAPAVGRTKVWFATEERARMVTSGSYGAYLLPEGRWLNPPPIPESARYLGPVTFSSPYQNTAIATIEFTVPDVPSGRWTIAVCNDPCTQSMIGDLVGGSILIAESEAMARVVRLEERFELAREMARQDARRLKREVHNLGLQLDALQTRNKLLEARAETLEAARRATPRRPDPFPAALGWGLVGLTIVLGLVMFRPRRRRAPDVDGPVEPPLVEWIEPSDREPALRR